MQGLDVAIVGGGPTGIVTATLLARRGFRVRVWERELEVYDLPRAITIDDEIQRVFQSLGLTDGLLAVTTPLAGAEFVTPDGERIMGNELPTDRDWPLGHHPAVTFYQPELEAFCRRCAIEAGVDLRLGVEVDAESVTEEPGRGGVRFEAADGSHRADWLVAADGASSPIRKALGVAFEDLGFDQDWLVLDARLKRPVPSLPDYVQQICDPARPVTFVVGHGDYRRWEFQLQPGEDRERMVTDAALWDLLDGQLTPDDAELVRAVVYRFHATVAERMRVGRIFLAGDAAHQMPPFLGQGMCSGIRDGANLVWKLALAAGARAGGSGSGVEALLDTYDAERRPHAAGVVAHAVDTGRLIDQLAGRESHGVSLEAAYGGARPFPRQVGGLGWGDHEAVGRQVPQPEWGGRLLDEWAGPGFTILVRDRAVADGVDPVWSELASLVEVPPEVEGPLAALLPDDGAIVVRPDRYVAAVADHADALVSATDWLADRFLR